MLQRSSVLHSQSPFLVVGQEKNISYNESNEIAKWYKTWIQYNLHQQLRQFPAGKVEVVIAFLSHNSPELMLAMIASMDIPMNFEQKCLDGGICDVHSMTAMLNVRWSPNEVASALSVKRGEGQGQEGSAFDHHLTIILHSYETTDHAKEACVLNNTDDMQTSLKHRAFHILLPNFNSAQLRLASHSELVIDDEQACRASRDEASSIHDDAILLFTSGTTSGPKGVRLSNLSLMIQSMAKTTSPCSYNSSSRMLATTVPFFHVGGISSALAVIMAGGSLVFQSASSVHGFNPHLVLNSMSNTTQIRKDASLDINTLVIVPAMLHAIFHEIESREIRSVYARVQLLLVGGQSITAMQLQKASVYFPNAKIVQTFACTEAGSSITFATLFDPKMESQRTSLLPMCTESSKVLGSFAGFPPQHIDLQIFELDENNEATDKIAKPFTVGVIGTKGPHVMNGYWFRGLENINQLSHDWLKMNDLGYLNNNGQLFFCGRSNDVIRTGGETVFSPEVERILIQHPDIDQCAVFALPDDRFGECVCAAIVYREPFLDDIIAADNSVVSGIRSFCAKQNLSGYKRPKVIFQCRELPRNSSGKVLKHQLATKCEVLTTSIKSKL